MRSIIKVAMRVIIVFMLIRLLGLAVNIWSGYSMNLYGDETPEEITAFFIGLIVVYFFALAALVLLWFKTNWLVRIFAGNADEHAMVIETSESSLLRVALRIIGFYLIAISIPTLLGEVASQWVWASTYGEVPYIQHDVSSYIARWVKMIFTLLVGIWLASGMVGAKQVQNFWNSASFSSKAEKESEKDAE